MHNAPGISAHQWLGQCHRRGGAAAHNRQRAIFRPRLTARYRCIDRQKMYRRQPPRKRGRYSCVVNKHRIAAHRGKNTVLAQRDPRQIIVIAHTADYRVRPRRCLRRRWCHLPTMRACPGLRLCVGTVEHSQFMPGRRQMARHWGPHHANADKCDLCHGNSA